MSYLIVVAHPDDEVLGAGGTIYKLAQKGEEVNVCIMSGKVQARNYRPTEIELDEDIDRCRKRLGVKNIVLGNFPNIKMNTVPHLELVQFIEKVIIDTEAEVLITHHVSDLNNDHVQTSLACQAACRLFQRNPKIKPLKELLYMEVPSATEWGLCKGMEQFNPNTFVEIGKEGLDVKIDALYKYRGVMREYPHPRSEENISGLAAYRGAQSGYYYAEAFESAFRRGF